MTTPILKTRDLHYSYPNGVPALRNVSVSIAEGKKTALLGPNGAGKSTLFLHFNGILRPRSGDVRFMDEPLRYDQAHLASLREQVAIVLQNPDDQIFSATVEEDVAFGPLNLRLEREEVEARIDEALDLVGMNDLRERPTQQLSFGQRKRVSLAGALAMKPKVLIMDEPTAGLDSEMVHELIELSDELNHRGMTLIMSTHDMEIAYEWADEMMVMFKGEHIFNGTPEEMFTNHELIDKLRIVPPFPVRINQQMHFRAARPETPFPRNLVEVTGKCFPFEHRAAGAEVVGGGKFDPCGGTLYVVDVDDPDRSEQVNALEGRVGDIHNRSGAYGAKARRLVREGDIDVHHSFHALENAILQVSLGQDYILFTDTALMSLIGTYLARVERTVGLRTNVTFCSHMARPG